MKKALTISIAGTVFTIEEDAYGVLDNYLNSIKNYFGSNDDSKEIINDIEARIAERFLERSNPTGPVTLDDVNNMISVMGRVEDFEGGSSTSSTSEQKGSYQGPRRLYRNPDDVWVMGVASGIAAYFGIDPLLTRLGFIILTLITGFLPGIVIYFVLALIIPSAETSAQKMQMRGGPANLQSFKESMNEYSTNIKTDSKKFGEHLKNRSNEFAENIKKSASELKEQWHQHDHHSKTDEDARQPDITEPTSRGLIGVIRSLVRLVFKLVGFAIKLVATLGIVFVVLLFIALAFRLHPFSAMPFLLVMPWPMYYLALVLFFLAVVLPLSLLSLVGNVVMLRGKPRELSGAIGIIGTWFAVVLILVFIGISYGPTLKDRVDALPQYQTASEVKDLSGFTHIDVHGIDSLDVTNGPTYSVRIEGIQESLDQTSLEVKDSTLVINKNKKDLFCFFCYGSGRTKILVTMPETDSVSLHDATSLSGTIASTTSQTTVFTLSLADASRGTLTLTTPDTHISLSDASHLTLSGSGERTTVIAHDVARFDGTTYMIDKASVEAADAARVHIYASSTLDVKASDVSRVYYAGNPEMTEQESDIAHVEQE